MLADTGGLRAQYVFQVTQQGGSPAKGSLVSGD